MVSKTSRVRAWNPGLSRPESAAAEPAVEPWPEFKDELGGFIAVGGSVCAGKAGKAHCLSAGPVFGIDQGQFVNAPFAIEAASAFAPVEIVAIQFPMVADGIAPVLAQDLRPLGQQVSKTPGATHETTKVLFRETA
jgi:hypothetical protein